MRRILAVLLIHGGSMRRSSLFSLSFFALLLITFAVSAFADCAFRGPVGMTQVSATAFAARRIENAAISPWRMISAASASPSSRNCS